MVQSSLHQNRPISWDRSNRNERRDKGQSVGKGRQGKRAFGQEKTKGKVVRMYNLTRERNSEVNDRLVQWFVHGICMIMGIISSPPNFWIVLY